MTLQKPFSKILNGLILVSSGLFIFGCAQKAATNPALEEARSAVQKAQSNPDVVNNAPVELKRAESALDEGEQLLEQNADKVKIDHQAYMAKQQAAIAQQIGQRAAAEDAILQAGAQRKEILLEARSAQAQSAEQRATQLEKELAKLQAVPEDRGTVITMGDVVFDVNKATLKPGGLLAIDRLAEFLEKYPSRRVMIEGFTDSTGSAEHNQELSERRAKAVRDALTAKGVDPSRLDVRGYGENFPVASNNTAVGRQLNRRVEVVISNGDGKVPERTG
jgi:outer membrane protein OmpA-like peptidoglycan-associated protein